MLGSPKVPYRHPGAPRRPRPSARTLALAVGALLALPVTAGAVRLSDMGPYLIPSTGADLTQLRAQKAALLPGDPASKIESGVSERATILTQALSSKRTAISTSPRAMARRQATMKLSSSMHSPAMASLSSRPPST